jgi:hypothetical protein
MEREKLSYYNIIKMNRIQKYNHRLSLTWLDTMMGVRERRVRWP